MQNTPLRVPRLLACPGCGARLPASLRECPECGLVLWPAAAGSPGAQGQSAAVGGAQAPAAGPVSAPCPGCGAQVLLTAGECPDCRLVFTEDGPEQGVQNPGVVLQAPSALYMPPVGAGRYAAALLAFQAFLHAGLACVEVQGGTVGGAAAAVLVRSGPVSALLGGLLAAAVVATAAATLACPLYFLSWFYRCYSNLPLLRRLTPRYRPDWVVWAFLVPVLSLFRPWQMMCEVWQGSSPDSDRRPDTSLVTAWWLLWMGGYVVGLWAEALSSPGGFGGVGVQVLSRAMTALAAGVGASMVRLISDMQEARWRQVGVGLPPPVAAG